EWVQMDFVGPLPRTKRKNKYILVAVEVVTRWCEAIPCKAATGAEVVKFLEEVLFPRFGAVRNIQTDQGSHFRNHEVAAVTDKYKVTHHFSTAYHPQSNGIVERQNQTLARMLARLGGESDWDQKVPQALMTYRATRHATTGFSPSELLYGWNIRLPIENEFPGEDPVSQPIEAISDQRLTYIDQDLHQKRQLAITNTRTRQLKRPKKTPDPRFKIGDKVYRHLTHLTQSHSNKLGPKWDGPYKIRDVLDKGTYLLETIEKEPRLVTNPVHGCRLQICNLPVQTLE